MGTRPEAIKLAPVVQALRRSTWADATVLSTGQHREMLDQVFDVFGLEADADLDLFVPGQSLSDLTSRAVSAVGDVVGRIRPDLVVVQGDTTSAFAGALSAYYHRTAVAHVEAGLRTGDLFAPHPEEANRRMIGVLTTLHLAATETARANLLRENTDPTRIVVTGNTVIDALLWTVARDRPHETPELERLHESDRRVVLVTAHRRESWGKPMFDIGRAIGELAKLHRDVEFVVPMHRNPAVREALAAGAAGDANVHLIEPLDYSSFARLLARSALVMTDSGGVQEEAPSLGKAVMVLRETTERPEGVAAGNAMLVGTDQATIVRTAHMLLSDDALMARHAVVRHVYGDGRAAERCVDEMGKLLHR
jgi:UDP-N-acetylglucosamine 2-epimerase (non-hydrolysing)